MERVGCTHAATMQECRPSDNLTSCGMEVPFRRSREKHVTVDDLFFWNLSLPSHAQFKRMSKAAAQNLGLVSAGGSFGEQLGCF